MNENILSEDLLFDKLKRVPFEDVIEPFQEFYHGRQLYKKEYIKVRQSLIEEFLSKYGWEYSAFMKEYCAND